MEYLQKIKVQVIENLKRTTFAPSVQMTDVPHDPEGMNDEADAELDDLDEDENPDTRYTKRRWDKYIEKDGELSDSEDEDENEANGVHPQSNAPKRRRDMNFQNPGAAPDDKDMNEAGSARSERSRNGSANGIGSHTASDAEGIRSDDSEGETFEEGREDSLSTVNREEEDDDIDMAEELAANGIGPVPGPQEATPPESPPTAVTTNPTVPAHVVEETGDDAMDEGDSLENDPEFAKEDGRDEREKEDVTAEQATEVVEWSEQ